MNDTQITPTIRFRNETDNFNPGPHRAPRVPTAIDRMALFTTKVGTYNGNRRMNIPELLLETMGRPEYILFSVENDGTEFYLDFKPPEITPPHSQLKKVICTGRAYFITIPRKWISPHEPTAAQLIRTDYKHTKYKVNLYD